MTVWWIKSGFPWQFHARSLVYFCFHVHFLAWNRVSWCFLSRVEMVELSSHCKSCWFWLALVFGLDFHQFLSPNFQVVDAKSQARVIKNTKNRIFLAGSDSGCSMFMIYRKGQIWFGHFAGWFAHCWWQMDRLQEGFHHFHMLCCCVCHSFPMIPQTGPDHDPDNAKNDQERNANKSIEKIFYI